MPEKDKTPKEMIQEIHEKIIRWDERLFGPFGLQTRHCILEILVASIILFLAAAYGTDFTGFVK